MNLLGFLLIVYGSTFMILAVMSYLSYHTFEVAYGSEMSCREAIGGSRDLNAFQYSEKIRQKVPQLAEFIANGRENI